MKKFALKAAVIAIAGYLGVVGYIHQYDKGQSEKLLAEGNYSAEQKKVAKILFDNGCQYCHTSNADLPFYANLPFADSVLSHDIESGKRVFLLNKLLDGLKDPSKLSEVDLAKLERVIENNEMPVATFRHLHWGSRPDENEKTTLLNWIREQRKAFLPANTEGTNPHSLIQPIPDSIMTDPVKVELGRKLFMDDRLSKDGTVQSKPATNSIKVGLTAWMSLSVLKAKKAASTHQPYLTPHLTLSNSGMVVQSISLTKQVDHRLTRLKWEVTHGMTS